MEKVIPLNLGFTKIYLLRTDSGYIQFDTGSKHNVKKYLRFLDDYNILPEEIKLIIINHAHFDHTGALKTIQKLTNAQVLVHENDEEFLVKGISAEAQPLTFLAKVLISTVPKSWTIYEPVEPDIVIQDEYSLYDFGLKAKVIHTPGHTLGTVAVVTEEGDAIIGCSAHGFPIRLRSGFPRVAMDEESVWKSWERIIGEGAEMIYISHGKPFRAERIKKKLRKRQSKIEKQTKK
ncbi:MAG: MBL fold metallo-hydrolase [Candidatus Heimdallarchaeota archaeon]|nr:MBL fold metallo-hydrolase [Candidatus Heimdallarchaeota archaeon]